MKKFIKQALSKIEKISRAQIYALIEQLALENDRLHIVLDSMNDGVLVADLHNRLIISNKSMKYFISDFQMKPSERPVWELINNREISALSHDALINRATVRERVVLEQKAHSNRYLSCSVIPLVHKGRIEGNILQIKDITAHQMHETQLRRAESLASLTNLAATVAHEIKNPLGSLAIHAQLANRILSKKKDNWEHNMTHHITVVLEEIERLNKIVVDFLTAVRPTNMKLAPSDLNVIVTELATLVHAEADTRYIELDLQCGENIPLVYADRRYLRHALLNIIKNGIDAMPNGGTLQIGTSMHENNGCISIIDTGVGMSPEVQEHIFDPYFTTKTKGSGIGLTFAYKVIKEQGGHISILSAPNEGSRFDIYLPIIHSAQKYLEWK